MHNPCKESFEKWWEGEGVWMVPSKEDRDDMKPVLEAAWSNGAYKMLEAVEYCRLYDAETKE
jgi:hypothetical protein